MRERPAQTVSRAETGSGRRAGSGVSGRNPAVSPERLSPTVQAELQQALGFGEAELVANREGRITRRQAVRLALRDATTWIAFAFFAILLIASVLYVLLVPIVLFFGAGVPLASVVPVLLSAVFGIGLAFLFRWGATYYLDKARRSLVELRVGAVTSREGPMSAIEERVQMARGSSYVHFLIAGGERYGIPFAVYRVFEEGAKYRAFFMPESKVVVAVETIDQPGESAGLRHHHRGYPLEMRMGQIVFLPVGLVLSAAILVAGLLLGNPPAALLGLGCLLLTGFLVRALVRGW